MNGKLMRTLLNLIGSFGVEIVQMAIVLLLLPLFIFVRNQIWYARYALTGTSIVVALVAMQWVVERWIG